MLMLSMTRQTFAFAALAALIGCASTDAPPQPYERREPVPEAELFTPTRFSAEITGQGPDVILIPGLTSSRDVWDATVAQLSATHRVHALQLSGFAGEPVGAAAGDGPIVAPFVEELNRYIEHNHITRPALIGHSLGGVSALILARDHPSNVGRVMVVDALPFFSLMIDPNATAQSIEPQAAAARDQMIGMTSEQFAAGQTATMARLVRNETLRQTAVDWSLASDRSAVARGMYDIMTTDLRGDLAAIQTPVTIVYANNPAIAPEAAVTAYFGGLYAPLPNHRLVKIDDTFHFVPLDNPTAFAAAVEEFLR
jgi:pimeloyl-[acyl-carrier protein] methyl ester esterase